jgi:CRP/FNR family transcriptional regulator, anaerobic regulatory protein
MTQCSATAPAAIPGNNINIIARSGVAQAESSCSRCYVRNVCLPSGLSPNTMVDLDDLTSEKRRVVRGEALYSKGDTFNAIFAIRSGSFKSVAATGGGETKVTGLHLPAEVLGLDAINSRVHGYDAIALDHAEVCVITYRRLTSLALRRPDLHQRLLCILSADIARDGGLVLRLAGMPAKRRLAAFVLGLSMRYRALGYSATRLSIRIQRKDLASYLGLTPETVSRVFAALKRERLIDMHLREIHVRDFSGLSELVGY